MSDDTKKPAGRPPLATYTLVDGEIKRHSKIQEAGERLGIPFCGGSALRRYLNRNGVYKPRKGGVVWFVDKPVPDEAKGPWERYAGGSA